MVKYFIAVLCSSIPLACLAADYLTEVTSEPYPASGTPREIATRASTCMSQHLAAGTTDSPLIISSDLEGGIIVARSALKYSERLMTWKIRSTFTFEARDGRFRIKQTNLERLSESVGNLYKGQGWVGIGKWSGSGWKKVEEAFAASASKVAQCVTAEPKKDDW